MNIGDLNAFISTELAPLVERALNRSYTSIGAYYNPHTKWFYEGTVQVQLAVAIASFLERSRATDWLVLQEQPYPELPDQRADLWIVQPTRDQPQNNPSILIEVKADFTFMSANEDYQKISTAAPRHFDIGYVFFCADRGEVADWQRRIEIFAVKKNYARGIGRG